MRLISLILLVGITILVGCKEIKKTSNVDGLEKVAQNATTSSIQNSSNIFEKFIGRFEFDPYVGNSGIIWGEFYSPKTDSLIIYKIVPISEEGKLTLNKMNNDLCDMLCRQQELSKKYNEFEVKGIKVNYNFVLEQKDAGGSDVFNVKKPFEAQSFDYKNGNIIMGETKTYQTFDEIYQ